MNNIRQMRENKGMTQGQLAEKVGVSLDTISRYETGKRDPKATELRLMAEVLNCSVDNLLNPTQAPATAQGTQAAE